MAATDEDMVLGESNWVLDRAAGTCRGGGAGVSGLDEWNSGVGGGDEVRYGSCGGCCY